jgi:hypothetical protein
MPKNMGKMPMRLMGETPMLRRMAFFNGLLTLSRWMQNDPAGYIDGMNTYQYCSDSPVVQVDPLGLEGGRRATG